MRTGLTQEGQRFLDHAAAARYLGISGRLLYTFSPTELPRCRIGRRVLYDVVDLNGFMEVRKEGGA